MRHVVKIIELQAFGNSIIEYMLGKFTEGPQAVDERRRKKTDLRALFGGPAPGKAALGPRRGTPRAAEGAASLSVLGTIGMEALPLSWSKIPECQFVFNIISLCLGPYNTRCDLRLDTSYIFSEISGIATQAYRNRYKASHQGLGRPQYMPSTKHLNRLKSAALNNHAVSLFMNLTDQTGL